MPPFSMGGFSSVFETGGAHSRCSNLEHLLSFLKLMCRLEGPGSCQMQIPKHFQFLSDFKLTASTTICDNIETVRLKLITLFINL